LHHSSHGNRIEGELSEKVQNLRHQTCDQQVMRSIPSRLLALSRGDFSQAIHTTEPNKIFTSYQFQSEIQSNSREGKTPSW